MAKLSRRDDLSTDERRALDPGLDRLCRHAPGDEIIRSGAWAKTCQLMVAGMAARINGLADGNRTVTQLSIAGDFLDLHGLLMRQMDHGVVAITECVTASIAHAELTEIVEGYPHLARLLWLEIAIDGAIQREWFHRLARQDALGRMAHLFCELDARLEAVGLSDEDGFELPLTQRDLADCLGLSNVHVNRTLQELRRRRLVEWRSGRLRLLDREALVQIAEFDPAYLRLHRSPV
jgi:CRP-like cAMP-binding protein